MISIKIFEFNPIQVNTYILFDETKECVIVDPGCYGKEEENEISNYIARENLKPVRLIITHAHTDHTLGNNYIINKYNLGLESHKDGNFFIEKSKEWGEMLGFVIKDVDMPAKYLAEGDIITFGNSQMEVLFTPGHADGSLCFVCKKEKFVITGDVLFSGSIGRTDLPTGDYDVLNKNIKEKLYTLPDDFTVYPGHGPTTTIGREKKHNPFVRL